MPMQTVLFQRELSFCDLTELMFATSVLNGNKQRKPSKDDGFSQDLFRKSVSMILSCLLNYLHLRPITRKHLKHFDVEGVYSKVEKRKQKSALPNWHAPKKF